MSRVIEQVDTVSREDWLEARKSSIGASDVAAILGLSPWATPWEVWAEKTGRLDPWKGNQYTRAGQVFESAVLDVAELEIGKLQRNVRVHADGLPLASTCDALTVVGDNPVEAKTTGIVGRVYGEWGDPLTDDVPDYYLIQVHAQLICTQADLGYLFALISGRGVVEYHIEANSKLHEILGNKLSDWWERHVVQAVEPPREPMPSMDVIKRIRRQPNKTVELTESSTALIEARDRLKAEAKSLNERIKEAEKELLLQLEDAEAGTLPDGRTVTFMEQSRKGYTVDPTTFRTLRVKKASR